MFGLRLEKKRYLSGISPIICAVWLKKQALRRPLGVRTAMDGAGLVRLLMRFLMASHGWFGIGSMQNRLIHQMDGVITMDCLLLHLHMLVPVSITRTQKLG
ncbi:hypothetical protein Kintu_gp67 [Xanthomonas phage Kintu]